MTMHKGWKRRWVLSVEFTSSTYAIATANCGHVVVRMNNLARGQRVYCGKCAA